MGWFGLTVRDLLTLSEIREARVKVVEATGLIEEGVLAGMTGDEQRHNFASGYGTPAWFISIFPGIAYRPPPAVLDRLT